MFQLFQLLKIGLKYIKRLFLSNQSLNAFDVSVTSADLEVSYLGSYIIAIEFVVITSIFSLIHLTLPLCYIFILHNQYRLDQKQHSPKLNVSASLGRTRIMMMETPKKSTAE